MTRKHTMGVRCARGGMFDHLRPAPASRSSLPAEKRRRASPGRIVGHLALLLCATLIVCALPADAADVVEGWRGGSFYRPYSVSVNPSDGSCWVADREDDQVVHLDADGTELWRTDDLMFPASVSVNESDGSCWVANTLWGEVVHFAEDGAELWRGDGFGSPWSVSVDSSDNSCWVANMASDEVVHLAADGTELWIGSDFDSPYAVSANSADGSCWVADKRNDEVVHLAADGTELWRGGGFNAPASVSVSSADGTCWVADTANDEVVRLAADGTELCRVGDFLRPSSVSANPADRSCWVADTDNDQVVLLDADGSELWRGAGFETPYAVSADASDGGCWVADYGNQDVVRLSHYYTLALDGANGHVVVDGVPQALPWSDHFAFGTEVALEAVPDATYEFAGWSGDLSGATNPTTITMDRDKSVAATFSKIQHTLTLTGTGDGAVLVDGTEHALPWSGGFDIGTTVVLDAIPDACYEFASWSGDLGGAASPKSIKMDGPKAVTANFSAIEYTLNLSGSGAGSAVVDGTPVALPWSGSIVCGTTVTLEAVPEFCYEFAGWSGDLSGDTSPTVIVVDGAKSVAASFALIQYTLTVGGTQGGSVLVDGTPVALPWWASYACDTTVSIEALPDSCYEFAGWSGDASGLDSPIAVTMDGAKSVTASFTLIEYTLTLSGTEGGSVLVDGTPVSLPWSDSFGCGTSVTLEATPDTCYEFEGWSGDVTSEESQISVTVDGDTSVAAAFEQIQYLLSIAGTGGSVMVDGVPCDLPWSGSMLCGATVSLEAVPDAHKEFTGWSGDLAGAENPIDVTMDGEKAVTAHFSLIQYDLNVSGIGTGTIRVNGVTKELPWSDRFDYGTSLTLEAVPAEGWGFRRWDGDVATEENPLALFIEGDMNVFAVFGVVFTDVPSDYWAADAIEALADAGIVSGYTDGRYGPTAPVDRGSMAVYIARALSGGDVNVPDGPEEPSFPDVATDHWAFKYIEYAVSSSIVAGYGDGEYHADWTVTRGQMSVFVARSMVDPTGDEGLASYEPPATATFTDVPEGYWCFSHVEFLAANGVCSGYADQTYRPTAVVGRDQMAVYVARAFDLLDD
jgi:DNA-binding beta-propeller fold protein YncE